MGRSESLRTTLESLEAQTYRDFETVIVTEEGELARLRNEGAKRAKGTIFVFTDDDVVFTPNWLESIVKVFDSRSNVGGVSGPSVITGDFRRNRDLFRYPLIKKLYDWIFLQDIADLPGHIADSGAWSTGACNTDCFYDGPVQFLEACNMAFRKEVFEKVGGFDESYKGVGDWSEPDLSFRIRKMGYLLWFDRHAKLYHRPSRSGAFTKRLKDSHNRLENYFRFANRFVRPHWRHSLYKSFLRIYYLCH